MSTDKAAKLHWQHTRTQLAINLTSVDGILSRNINIAMRHTYMQITLTTVLETPRLYIRSIQEHDLKDLYRVFSDDDVTYFLPYLTWQDALAARSWYARVLEGAAAGNSMQLVMEDKASGEIIGTMILFRFDIECARAELGYALAQQYWGGGYMREALQALLPHAFTELGFHRIEAEVDVRNQPSAKLLRHLGFQEEGLMRQRWKMKGEYKDTWFFSLLQTDLPRI